MPAAAAAIDARTDSDLDVRVGARITARVVVLVPCHNEALAVGKVVDDFRQALPEARIVVVDNASTDATARIARSHGAEVLFEPCRGKGFVIAGMLERIDADVYLLVDGDDTYDPGAARWMLDVLASGRADMVVAARLSDHHRDAFRPLHLWGNRLISGLLRASFGGGVTDALSGYRAFTRTVARALPGLGGGFEVETEMTAHTLGRGLRIVEVPARYRPRPPGSFSKLRTWRDGARVLWRLAGLIQRYRLPALFGAIAGLLCGPCKQPRRDEEVRG